MADKAEPATPSEPKVEGRKGKKQWNKGKKKNQADVSEPTQAIQANKTVAATLPPPAAKQENTRRQDKIQTKEEAIFKEAIFSGERVLKPAKREVHFTPSFTGYTPLINDVYMSYKNEKKRMISKEFPPELLRYYAACSFWLRAIGIKSTTGMELSMDEERVFQTLENKKLNMPEPIYLALKSVGTTITKTGEKLVPDFPPIPSMITQTYPGSLGVVDVQNHNIYEEMPVIGPAIECLRERSHADARRVYNSVFAPAGTTANINLQGYATLNFCRREALQYLNDLNIEGIKGK